MLTTDDVQRCVFDPMRTAYGTQWKHAGPALRVWRNALAKFSVERISWAANEVLKHYVDHPPTLPQFLSVARKQDSQVATYLPAPTIPNETAKANRVLIGVLVKCGGVDRAQLMNLIELKNALVEEYGERPTLANLRDLDNQLTELAGIHDREAKERELFEARQKHCRKWSFPDPATQ